MRRGVREGRDTSGSRRENARKMNQLIELEKT